MRRSANCLDGRIRLIQVIGSLDHWVIGSLRHWVIGLLGHWVIGSLGNWVIGSLNYWVNGSFRFSNIKLMSRCCLADLFK